MKSAQAAQHAVAEAGQAAPPIRRRPAPTCSVCGGEGRIAYSGLRDRLFGAPGDWTLRRCGDPQCGLLWLDPMPVQEDLPRLYETYYTHEDEGTGQPGGARGALEAAYIGARYGYSDPSWWSVALATLLRISPGHRAQADLRAFGLNARPGGRLLDVGCGSGTAMIRMRDLGWEVEGVDFDAKAVELARTRGLNVRLGSLEDQGYPEGAFDAIVMSHVLEHVPDPRALLQECWRVLRSGGNLVCVTPNSSSFCHRRYGSSWFHLDPPRHLHIFAPSSMRLLVRQLGWPEAEITTTVASTHAAEEASRAISSIGRYDLLAEQKSGPLSGSYRKLYPRAIQFALALRLIFNRDLGDELVLIATKARRP